MTRPEIIELAHILSERKGEKNLGPGLNSLYRFVIQDICKRQRFWWRRVLVSLTMTPGTATYDLANSTTFPGLAEIALDEITKFTLILTPSPLQVQELVPVFDPETLIGMVFNTTQAQPSRYTIDANGSTVLRIDPPDKAYQAYIVGWGMANPPSDTTNDAVPLIPSWGHNTIVAGIVAHIFDFAYGSANQKTLTATAKYEQGILDLEQRKQFDPNYTLQLASTESAVRST
jgi:hypothetical protein